MTAGLPEVRDVSNLDIFRSRKPPANYPANIRVLYAPCDRIKPALAALLASATHSLHIAMYGFDDDVLARIIKEKLSHPDIFVQLTLDKSQAGGAHERAILADMDYPASSIAIGHSEHGRIIHTKMVVIDGLFTVGGSTNWSDQAERLQDNELTVIQDACVASEAAARLSSIHANILANRPALTWRSS